MASRSDRLPAPLRPLARNIRRRLSPDRYAWESDGMATNHYSPFLTDYQWTGRYNRMSQGWYPYWVDVRWRMWVLTSWAKQAQRLDGSFAEFGTYRGGCAYMTLACTESKPMWLYDTFAGIPGTNLGESERRLAGELSDTSVWYVEYMLAEWKDRIHVIAGDVFDTVPANDPGPLALAHIDLNAAEPTRHVLGFAYDRMVPGGAMIFDDYGWGGYEEQRVVLDEFFADKPETMMALPTSQGVIVKLPG